MSECSPIHCARTCVHPSVGRCDHPRSGSSAPCDDSPAQVQQENEATTDPTDDTHTANSNTHINIDANDDTHSSPAAVAPKPHPEDNAENHPEGNSKNHPEGNARSEGQYAGDEWSYCLDEFGYYPLGD